MAPQVEEVFTLSPGIADTGVGKDDDAKHHKTITVRISRYTARNPIKCLLGSLAFATLLSFIGLYVGKFKIEADHKGWISRHTKISNREMQAEVLNAMRKQLFEDDEGRVWDYVQNNDHPGYIDIMERNDSHRVLYQVLGGADLQTSSSCDTMWYSNWESVSKENDNLYAIWKVQPEKESTKKSILDKDVLSQICDAELNTLNQLENAGACGGCSGENECIPPHSLILVLRHHLGGNEMTCSDLMDAYTASVQNEFTDALVSCTEQMKAAWNPETVKFEGDTSACPLYFTPHLVDANFAVDGNTALRYTSSFFHTKSSLDDNGDMVLDDKVYDLRDSFDGADGITVRGIYDTINTSIYVRYTDALISSDMGLAVASLSITFLAIGIHTKSFWLTVMGVLQINYAIPMAYFFYTFVAQLKFFPFLNFIGVFVAAALGADDVFVAVDKWKNARILNAGGTVEDIAEVALPDAASAMFLTTSTTAVAFFATCICPVSPILCFAVFCGMMVVFNYMMNILIVFPALCIYDNWIQGGSRNCLVTCFQKKDREENKPDFMKQKTSEMSFIHRVLSTYADLLHRFRWPVMGVFLIAIVVCVYFGMTISLPDSSAVNLLPDDHPLEMMNLLWSKMLLSVFLFSTGSGGDAISQIQIEFGLVPGDTGNPNDPDELSKLILDETFDPRSTDSQEYLLKFCPILFAQDFANLPHEGYECPINAFDNWIQANYLNRVSDAYETTCNNATSLPMDPNHFDACLISWSQEVQDRSILANKGEVKTISMRAKPTFKFGAPHKTVDEAWHSWERWFVEQSSVAPVGVSKPFTSSSIWWWYDTNEQMVKTAVGAIGITLGFSAFIVLISARSMVLTLLSFGCILYVLAASTSSLVALGWDLGFMESICFSILVGISCDFVIHFGHAYIHQSGSVPSHIRSKFALISMGPSILAAAFTTFASSILMLFCKIVFFTKFATILLMTILHATIGSFVVYIVLTDTFGPAEPTKFIDGLIGRCFSKGKKTEETNDLVLEQEDQVLS